MISSVAGLRGSAGLAGYSATKGAVRLFAKSVALECAGARDDIRCNSVHPGIIGTEIWEKMPAAPRTAQLADRPRPSPRRSVPTGKLARRRTSPTACCSWPPTRRATSPGRSW